MSTSIFNTSSTTPSASPKVTFSHAELSSRYLDSSQPPTKELPFRQIRNIPYIQDVKICMPESVRESLYPHDTVGEGPQYGGELFPRLRYTEAVMTLKDILDDENLRRGNYLFLSASSSPSSNSTTISLDCGKLTIDMPSHIYQRAGLTFPTSKIPGGGRKHHPQSARHRIETDLRQPSMVKGKKGFDRLMYAAKNVEGLSESRTWMFYDLSDTPDEKAPSNKKRKRDAEDDAVTLTETSGSRTAMNMDTKSIDNHPLSKFNPTVATTRGANTTSVEVIVPSFVSSPRFFSTLLVQAATQQAHKANIPTILKEDIYDIAEYLSLIFLQSPRIAKTEYGKIDPYLCQYTLPDVRLPSCAVGDIVDPSDATGNGIDTAGIENLHTTSYSGFIPSAFMTQLLVDIIRRSRSTKISLPATEAWVAINIIAHPTNVAGSPEGLMLLLQAGDVTEHPTTDVDTGDTTMTEERSDVRNTEDDKSKSVSHRGFKVVTCFEFIDSSTG